MLREITIKDTRSDHVLARGLEGRDVLHLEGNWYFSADSVAMDYLRVSDRVYVCPHKGSCFWVDLVTPDYQIMNVAWVYTSVKHNYDYIKDRIAFYGSRGATKVE